MVASSALEIKHLTVVRSSGDRRRAISNSYGTMHDSPIMSYGKPQDDPGIFWQRDRVVMAKIRMA